MYYYSSSEFLTFLLAQPLSRKSIFTGFFAGVASTLSLSLLVGIGLPLLFYGVASSPEFKTFAIVLTMAILLSVIFSLIAFIIALRQNNRIKGFGIAIFAWLFFAVIYDGLFLLLLLLFRDYPLENLTLALTMANPIDLARILVLLNLDISAMMGYTGAVLENFFGKSQGTIFISLILFLWISLPFAWMIKLIKRKDF
jgi:Cu-processing system permease protein